MPESGRTFLQDASPAQLLRAVASNHRSWIIRSARAGGGEVHRANGAQWVYAPGAGGEVTIPFPRLAVANAGEHLDTILRYCRRVQPLQQVSCWSLRESPRPRDLGAWLAARGFEWGWQPHWMWLDLHKMRTDFRTPDGLRIEPVVEEVAWDVYDLPYYSRETAAHVAALTRARPRRVWHFAAWLDGTLVGHSMLNLTTGRLGVAGIFDVGVVPAARGQGIGTALTLAACQLARQLGCRHALLNATGMGEPVYRRLGFESLGYGQTWWMHRAALDAPPPAELQIRFAEAVGRGDIQALEQLGTRIEPEMLDTPLAGGMTLIQLAVMTKQPAAAAWLAEHGATLDLISAWDLGWKDRVRELLVASPESANARSGQWQITPLHEAASRGDAELARVLLEALPDLQIQDTAFHSTPLGWARHYGRAEIVNLIEQHQARV